MGCCFDGPAFYFSNSHAAHTERTCGTLIHILCRWRHTIYMQRARLQPHGNPLTVKRPVYLLDRVLLVLLISVMTSNSTLVITDFNVLFVQKEYFLLIHNVSVEPLDEATFQQSRATKQAQNVIARVEIQ